VAKIVLIGDSIRMGYAPFVIEALGSRHEIWQPEINGGPSCHVRDHLDEWVLARQPDVVHFNAGLHDMKRQMPDAFATPISDAFPPLNSPEQYRANLRLIFSNILQKTGARVIAALSTPVLESRQTAVGKNPQRRQVDVGAYNAVMRDVACEFALPINDLHQVAIDAGLESIMTRDGVHFTDDGSCKLAQAVVRQIEAALSR
jgi:lysophospholipase L1-like esterase